MGLRIGVLYDSWGPNGDKCEGTKGEIYFIRMRLVDKERKVMSQRITESEVIHSTLPQDEDCEISSMLERDVGGCCCDCCHKSCNCGLMGRFPDISTGNQFLTPTQFALLCRLGYDLSAEAVDAISSAQQ